MNDLSEFHDVLVVGADPLNEAPMLALALRQVHRRGGQVTVIDPRGIQLPFAFDHWAIQPVGITHVLRSLLHQLEDSQVAVAPSVDVDEFPVKALAKRLNSSPRPAIICGTDIVTAADIDLSACMAKALCRTHITAGLFYIFPGANGFAAGLMNDEPVSTEQIIAEIEAGRIRCLVAAETTLWSDFPDRVRLSAALEKLEHIVVLDYVDTPLNAAASTFIPTQTIYECGGHWINNEGRLQIAESLIAGGEPIDITSGGDHPPRIFDVGFPGSGPLAAWQVVMTVAGHHDDRFDTGLDATLADLHPAINMPLNANAGQRVNLEESAKSVIAEPNLDEKQSDDITLLLVDQTFGTESLSALSPTLDEVAPPPSAGMHPETMEHMGLTGGSRLTVSTPGGQLTLALIADSRLAPGVIVIPRHCALDWQIVEDTRLVLHGAQLTHHEDGR